MYLKRLELQGFKSFADRTVLEFRPGITAVIGPNGSGKSNISDSIRWVLGEQSMKSLRGSSSSDIIFAGTQNRKSLGFAEVSIVIDNTDGKLPIEYNEVTVTRKLYRSGETGYFINKAPCRLKDILELFMDTGIGKDGYSIIGQGKIDEILSNKSEDRRRVFEEAAGIVKYRTRKAESEKKLEQTKLNLLRINDILSEIEGSLEPLKLQSEKAKKFLDLREELKTVEVGLFLYNIESYREKLEALVKDEDIMQSQYDAENTKQEEASKLKERLNEEINQITQRIEEMQNEKFESSNQIEKMNSETNVAKQRMASNEENRIRFAEEIKEVEIRIQELEEEKKQKQEKKENLQDNRKKFEEELTQKEEELKELTQKLSHKELEIEEKKKTVEEYTNEKYEVAGKINAQDMQWETLQKRQKALKQEITGTIAELDSARMQKQELSKNFYEIEKNRNETIKKQEEIAKEQQESIQKRKSFEEKINQLSYEIRMKQSRKQFLEETEREKEGYNKSVKSLLLACDKEESLRKGMHGVLANLISVPKEYETAIEMALGAALQNIVTETEEDAKKLIQYLRDKNLGRASFLPITSVKARPLENLNQKGIEGVIGVASSLVSCKKQYEGIISNLLGKTVIVENMDSAIKLAKQNHYAFRIVTLQGDILNSSGSMTGGSVANKTVNILGRGREIEELEKQLQDMKQELERQEKQKQEYEDENQTLLEKVEALQNQRQEIETTYGAEKQKIIAIEETIQKLEKTLAKQKEEDAKSEEQKTENREEKQRLEARVQEISKEMEKLQLEIAEFVKVNQDNQTYIDNLNLDITNLKISVSSFDESSLSMEEMIERIEQDIQNQKISKQNKQQQIEKAVEENQSLQEKIKELEIEIEKIKERIANSGEEVETCKQTRVEKQQSLKQKEEEIQSQFKVLEDLKEQIVKMDIKKNKIEQDIQDTINTLWEEYEITPNHAEGYHKPSNVQQATKQVNQLRNAIRDLGSINIDSIDEYKKTKERYDFMAEQRLDLENAASNLRKMIAEMTETMKTQFAEKFKVINQNFNEVFVELFGGGKAELILEDENNILECGIDIRVQPTGKKLQNMMLLSGGERAFTAIALLFAILKINPAPFCILDEIEAALDDVNVYRFAEYLKKFSKETQFLVITHRKGTMESADAVYGVTMEENGISKLLSMRLGQ